MMKLNICIYMKNVFECNVMLCTDHINNVFLMFELMQSTTSDTHKKIKKK